MLTVLTKICARFVESLPRLCHLENISGSTALPQQMLGSQSSGEMDFCMGY
jgi:hypothetical protein